MEICGLERDQQAGTRAQTVLKVPADLQPTTSRGAQGGRIPPPGTPAVLGDRRLIHPERGHAEVFCGVSCPPHSLALLPGTVLAPGMCPSQEPEQRAGGEGDGDTSVPERCRSLGSSPKLPLSIFVLEVLPSSVCTGDRIQGCVQQPLLLLHRIHPTAVPAMCCKSQQQLEATGPHSPR